MNRRICQNCGTEVIDSFNEPLTFCTNCGLSLINQSFGADTQETRYSPNRKTGGGLSGTGKLAVGILIFIPIVLILAAIIGIGILIKVAMDKAPSRTTTENYPLYENPQTDSPESKTSLTFGSDGIGQGQFKNASALAIGKDGQVYVGDGTLRIQKFDADGKFLRLWNVTESSETADETYSKRITDLAIDSKNTVYAVVANKDLLRYNGETGEFIDKIKLYGDKFVGQTMEARVLDVFMQADDKLAVFANSFPDGEFIYLVSPDGKVQTKHKNLLKSQNKNSTLLMKGNILINVTGDIFLLNGLVQADKAYIYRFKSDGSYVDRFTWEGAPTIGFISDKIIALNSKGEIYIYNRSKKQINVLSTDGVFQRNIPVAAASFDKMILGPDDSIYILSGEKVEKFSPQGN